MPCLLQAVDAAWERQVDGVGIKNCGGLGLEERNKQVEKKTAKYKVTPRMYGLLQMEGRAGHKNLSDPSPLSSSTCMVTECQMPNWSIHVKGFDVDICGVCQKRFQQQRTEKWHARVGPQRVQGASRWDPHRQCSPGEGIGKEGTKGGGGEVITSYCMWIWRIRWFVKHWQTAQTHFHAVEIQ